MKNTRVQLLLADPHLMVRQGLTKLFSAEPDLDVVAHAANGRETLELSQSVRPDLAVVELGMPDLRGPELIREMHASCPDVPVVALTRRAETSYLQHIWQTGVAGFVPKHAGMQVLLAAVRAVAAGDCYLDPGIAGRLVTNAVGRVAPAALSDREEQVLRAIAWGHSNKEIGIQLGLSTKTVESYRATGQRKLGLHSRTDILRHALISGWLSEDNEPQ